MFGKIYGGGDFALKSKTFFKLHLHCLNSGEMQEWFNWHAWKACVPQKGTGGSNPFLSANHDLTPPNGGVIYFADNALQAYLHKRGR